MHRSLAAAALFAILAAPAAARGAVITVDTLADLDSDADNACSLREAIQNANGDDASGSAQCAPGSGADLIRFTVAGGIVVSSTLPAITDSDLLTIVGADAVFLDGDNLHRVLQVNAGATAELRRLDIVKGFVADEAGAGIFNAGTLTLRGCAVAVNNSVPGINGISSGGGIANGGALTVIGGTFSTNGASFGGAITSSGSVDLLDTTLAGNSATSWGGAIFNNGPLRIRRSTLSGNTADELGGALLSLGGLGGTPLVEIENSTLTGNGALQGEAVYLSGGALSLLHATVADNGPGHGVFIFGGSSSVTNSILGAGDPLLGPLQNNGGLTETRALLPGHPSIDAALSNCTALDQRGYARPADGDGDNNPVCDFGAFEAGASPLPLAGVGAASPAAILAGQSSRLEVTVSPATGPDSTNIQVSADLSTIGGSASQPLVDDGTGGDLAAGDLVFSFDLATAPLTAPGVRSFPATITDAEGRQAGTQIGLEILNTPPFAGDDDYSTPSGTPLVVAAPGIIANDGDPNGLTLALQVLSGPSSGTLQPFGADGSFTYQPNPGFFGTDSFLYQVDDGLDTATATVTIEVLPAIVQIPALTPPAAALLALALAAVALWRLRA